MFRKFNKRIGSVDFQNFGKKGELIGLKANCKSGYVAIYQEGNKFIELKNFLLCNEYNKGLFLKDGSRLLIKGWMSIIKFGSDHYHLFPMCGSFGFFHGPVNPVLGLEGKNIYSQEKFDRKQETFVSYLIDSEKNMIYQVEEFIFNEDPFSFDLFNGSRQIMLFKRQKEIGLINKGSFYHSSAKAKIIVDPIAEWWLNKVKTT